MDSALDDDICILTHEKADCMQRRDQRTPFSASSGEASVASHFALVTAYEDIKKRLKETEKENYSLKRRLRQLEEKLSGNNETSMVEKSLQEMYIERDSLLNRLNIMEKERLECTKTLNEQLQSKELELLQIRTELETHQVMKSLNKNPSDWEIEKMNNDLKMRSLEQELQLSREECRLLRAELQRKKDSAVDMNSLDECLNLIPERYRNTGVSGYSPVRAGLARLLACARVPLSAGRCARASRCTCVKAHVHVKACTSATH
ncbi:hypothetical protein XENTR_v10016230 [Xenopus tropicalis]|nr:hypothetical protein XENTR_v10016230 [Xenopus tropicalis]